MGGMTLRDAPVLVTGASSGIGRALAFALAGRGARLAIAARRTANLTEIADQIAAEHERPVIIEADLSRAGAAATLAEQALAELGSVRVLINNAGVAVVGAQGTLGDDAQVRALFETNFWSPLALTRALLPGLQAVANVTSSLQAVPIPSLAYYGASKAALAHATRTLRHELADVSVLEVVPGATDTDARDIDLLPWRSTPMRTPPPVSPESAADAIVTALERGRTRRVHPRTSLLPLELPAIGRLIARTVTRRLTLTQ
ncbi:SDR family NAD(P)-dependent oxidoreductase [Actinomadura rugatobispora]|uniref:SDR family NAD(P)-dependent oxidoreductase n=1 Tax=Actinomadura rugatobispora TaxID=1994 RepID=A0ABW1AGK3_9ACTN|nr:SDR family oxidoreductase [Actinomadura rugatobispora]